MAAKKERSKKSIAQVADLTGMEYAGDGPGEGPLLYSNSVGVTVSFYDIQLRFDRVVSTSKQVGEASNVLVHQGVVAMSPQHAKTFSALLARQIEAYESEFGKIETASGAEA